MKIKIIKIPIFVKYILFQKNNNIFFVIGHAVNDVTDDLTQDVLANKMVCYVAQGISKAFSQV